MRLGFISLFSDFDDNGSARQLAALRADIYARAAEERICVGPLYRVSMLRGRQLFCHAFRISVRSGEYGLRPELARAGRVFLA